MRISDNTIVRNYMTTLSRNAQLRNREHLRAATGRSFQTVAEDPVAAMKAMKIRRSMSRVDDYQSNIADLNAITDEREAAISEISDILTEISGLMVQGQSGTYSASDRESIAASLRGYQETIFDISNSSYCGKYIFGGTNEYEIPFTLDTNGDLCYQGRNVNTEIFTPESTGMDISAGATVNAVVSGASLFGSKLDGNGLSNNVYNFVKDLASAFETNNLDQVTKYSKKLTEVQEDITIKYAEIGAQSEFIEFFSDRLNATETNLTTRQTSLEGVDPAQAIMDYKQISSVYDATLAMGAKMIPQTLLDYIS